MPIMNAQQPQMMNWNMPTSNMNMGPVGMPPVQQLPMQNNMQMNQQPPRINVVGRMVSSLEEITVQDVPTDGSASFFPKSDYSCIYAKQWGSNGLIQTVKYVPEKVEETNPPVEEGRTSEILQRLENIEKMLKRNGNRNRRSFNKQTEGGNENESTES